MAGPKERHLAWKRDNDPRCKLQVWETFGTEAGKFAVVKTSAAKIKEDPTKEINHEVLFEKIISILGYLFNSTGKSRGALEKDCRKLSLHGSETQKFYRSTAVPCTVQNNM